MPKQERKQEERAHTKVTREDWLNAARLTLVQDGEEQVKILGLSEKLGVSRSSFYWYFENRTDLLNALLADWERRNTAVIAEHCDAPAYSITAATCNFFRCFVDGSRFDSRLDFTVREWARRDEALRRRVDAADAERIAAVTRMFTRFGYWPADADARARILYFMQLGYHALDVREPVQTRLGRIVPYLRGFTGVEPEPAVVEAFVNDILALNLPDPDTL